MVTGSTNSAFITQEHHMSFKPILTLDKDIKKYKPKSTYCCVGSEIRFREAILQI